MLIQLKRRKLKSKQKVKAGEDHPSLPRPPQ